MKFILRILLLLVFLAPLVGLGDAPAQSEKRSRAQSHYENLELFGAVYEHLMRNYVDELDPEEVIERAVEAMLAELDPHSQLLTEEIYNPDRGTRWLSDRRLADRRHPGQAPGHPRW